MAINQIARGDDATMLYARKGKDIIKEGKIGAERRSPYPGDLGTDRRDWSSRKR